MEKYSDYELMMLDLSNVIEVRNSVHNGYDNFDMDFVIEKLDEAIQLLLDGVKEFERGTDNDLIK